MDTDELAELGYNAYGDCALWKNFLGNPMPRWIELPTEQKISWSRAARAIADQMDVERTGDY